MKSPFPGMDPWLERRWRDLHHRFLTYACDDMQSVLPGRLRARLEERVCVAPNRDPPRTVIPDIHVIERPGFDSGGGTATATAVDVCEPVVIYAEPDEEYTEGYIEIIDVESGDQVITVLELLSLSNKQKGFGHDKYLQKQQELLAGGVSLVEIDLLRSGEHTIALGSHRIHARLRTPYRVCVCRGWQTYKFEYYPCPLNSRLPSIRIPLRETDDDIRLDIQSLIDRCYQNGRYDDTDYSSPPVPALDPETAEWAASVLKARD